MDIVVELENGLFGIVEDAHNLELEGAEVECWVDDGKGFVYQKEVIKHVM